MFRTSLFSPVLAAAMFCGCNSQSPPPPQSPAAQQEEARAAERKAASVEAEMNKNAQSEDIAKPDAGEDESAGHPKEPAPPQ
jgi:hypothetical protein